MTLTAVAFGQNSNGQLGGGYRGGESLTPQTVLLSGFRSVIPGYYSTWGLMAGGGVRALGDNNAGELGNGTRLESAVWTQVKGLSGVTQLACGGAHALALLKGGTVATWGGNSFGTLGVGTEKYESGSPVPVFPALSGVASVYAGGAMCAAILTDGSLVAWGEGKSGAMGDGTLTDKTVPTPVGVHGVKAVALGGLGSVGGHMLILLNDGTVLACGKNKQGQLGDGSTINRSVPTPVKGLTGVVAIAAGPSHSLALLNDGTVVGWGSNSHGELAAGSLPFSVNPIKVLTGCSAFAAGLWTTLAIAGGRLYACGWGRYGVVGSHEDRHTPTVILEEAVAVHAGEYHATALVKGAGPAPVLSCTVGKGSVTVTWTSVDEPRWIISHRKAVHPRVHWEGSEQSHNPKLRTWTVSGLPSGVPVEVGVEAIHFGERTITAVPS